MTTSPASPEPNDPLPSLEELINEARRIARALLAVEKRDEMKLLNATEVVNSVFGPMLAQPPEYFAEVAESPEKLIAFINTVIRNKLASYARRFDAEKRPKIDPAHKVHDQDFEELQTKGVAHFTHKHPAAAIDVADGLAWLENEEPRLAQVVQLHFFHGMTDEEAGKFLGFSTVTAKRARQDGVGLLRKWMTAPPSPTAE